MNYELVTGRKEKQLDLNQYKDQISGKRILIAGIGTIGNALSNTLADLGARLILIDINEENLSKIRDELDAKENKDYKLYLHDLKLGLPELFQYRSFDYVINTAAYKHVFFSEQNPKIVFENNINISKTLLSIPVNEKHILISTDKAVNPTNVMGKSKRICEFLYMLEKKTKIIRFGNVYASSGSLVPRIVEGIKHGIIQVTDPEATRYFMTINEAVQLIVQAMFSESFTNILDMGEPLNIKDLITKMIELSGKEVQIKDIGLLPGEKLHEELRYEKTIDRHEFIMKYLHGKTIDEMIRKMDSLDYEVI